MTDKAVMVVRFWLRYEEKPYISPLLKVTNSDIIFTTNQKISVGQDIKLSIYEIANDRHVAGSKPVLAKVSKIKKEKNKLEITADFVTTTVQGFDTKSRRKYQRTMVNLNGRFKRKTASDYQSCQVIDISKKGVRFACGSPFKINDTLEIMVLPEEGETLAHMLHVSLLVKHCVHIGHSKYEIGGEFIDVKTENNNPSEKNLEKNEEEKINSKPKLMENKILNNK